MSTPNTVKAQIQSLIDTANEVTGNTDADLTSAVNGLVDAYNDEHTLRESIIDGSVTEIYSEVETIFAYASAYRQQLRTAILPNVKIIAEYAFTNNINLSNISIPSINTIGTLTFGSCYSLENIDAHNVTSISAGAFAACTILSNVIIRNNNSVCDLGGSNVFVSTPIESGTGYIYVPSALLEEYKAATNWVVFASQFRALEDYTVDGTTTGEIDWDKINGGAA